MTDDLHTLGFRAGLDGQAMHEQWRGNAYYEMAYRDGAEERRRRELVRGEKGTDWSAA